jgi:hypothetical protein
MMPRARASPTWLVWLLLPACGSTLHPEAADRIDADADSGANDAGAPDAPAQPVACPLPPSDGGAALIPGPSEAEVATQAACSNGWCRENPFPTDVPIADVWGSASDAVWFAGQDGEVLYWDGARFHELIPSGPHRIDAAIYTIWGSGPDDVWIGDSGGARHFDGLGWGSLLIDGRPVFSIAGTGPDDIWFGGDLGKVVHTNGTSSDVAILIPNGTSDDVILGIWAGDPGLAWAVGSQSTIARFSNGAWQPMTPDGPLASTRLRKVWGRSSDDVWIIGDDGAVAHWNGETVHVEATFTTSALTDVWGDDAELWIVGGQGAVFRRVGGAFCNVWFGPRLDFDWIWGSGADDVWIGSGLQIFRWDGQRWSERSRVGPTESLRAVTSTPDGVRWLRGSNLYRWDDAGIRVETTPPGDGRVQVFGASDMWTVAPSPAAITATVPWHWDGAGWSAETTPTDVGLNDVAGATPDLLWAAGEGVMLQRTASGWQPSATVPDLTGATVGRLWFLSPSEGWALGGGTVPLLRWNGTTWTPFTVTDVGAQNVTAAWGTSADGVWFSTDAGLVHWDGATFALVLGGAGPSWVTGTGRSQLWTYGIAGVDPGTVLAWKGSAWSLQPTPTAKVLRDGWTTPGGDTYLVGDDGIVLHRRAGTSP